jgi:hypothetical protein
MWESTKLLNRSFSTCLQCGIGRLIAEAKSRSLILVSFGDQKSWSEVYLLALHLDADRQAVRGYVGVKFVAQGAVACQRPVC